MGLARIAGVVQLLQIGAELAIGCRACEIATRDVVLDVLCTLVHVDGVLGGKDVVEGCLDLGGALGDHFTGTGCGRGSGCVLGAARGGTTEGGDRITRRQRPRQPVDDAAPQQATGSRREGDRGGCDRDLGL